MNLKSISLWRNQAHEDRNRPLHDSSNAFAADYQPTKLRSSRLDTFRTIVRTLASWWLARCPSSPSLPRTLVWPSTRDRAVLDTRMFAWHMVSRVASSFGSAFSVSDATSERTRTLAGHGTSGLAHKQYGAEPDLQLGVATCPVLSLSSVWSSSSMELATPGWNALAHSPAIRIRSSRSSTFRLPSCSGSQA